MNTEPDKTVEQRLEAATSADVPSDAIRDEQTARLREGWQAMGEMLEAAYPATDRAIPLPSMPLPAMPREKLGRRRRCAGLIAAAAAVVACVAVGWGVWWMNRPGVGSRGQIAKPVESPKTTVPIEIPNDVPVANDFAWDDELDERLAVAGRGVAGIRDEWDDLDNSFDAVYDGLQQIQEDIEGSTL